MEDTQENTVYDRLAVQFVTCPHCKAKPGIKCYTKSGKVAMYVHADRLVPVREAYRAGKSDANTAWAKSASKDIQKTLNRLLTLKNQYEKKKGW